MSSFEHLLKDRSSPLLAQGKENLSPFAAWLRKDLKEVYQLWQEHDQPSAEIGMFYCLAKIYACGENPRHTHSFQRLQVLQAVLCHVAHEVLKIPTQATFAIDLEKSKLGIIPDNPFESTLQAILPTPPPTPPLSPLSRIRRLYPPVLAVLGNAAHTNTSLPYATSTLAPTVDSSAGPVPQAAVNAAALPPAQDATPASPPQPRDNITPPPTKEHDPNTPRNARPDEHTPLVAAASAAQVPAVPTPLDADTQPASETKSKDSNSKAAVSASAVRTRPKNGTEGDISQCDPPTDTGATGSNVSDRKGEGSSKGKGSAGEKASNVEEEPSIVHNKTGKATEPPPPSKKGKNAPESQPKKTPKSSKPKPSSSKTRGKPKPNSRTASPELIDMPELIVKREMFGAMNDTFIQSIQGKATKRKRSSRIGGGSTGGGQTDLDDDFGSLLHWFGTQVFSGSSLERVGEAIAGQQLGSMMSSDVQTLAGIEDPRSPDAMLRTFRVAVHTACQVQTASLGISYRQCEKIYQTHAAFETMMAEMDRPGSELHQQVTKHCTQKDIVIKRGVDNRTLLWEWLMDANYPPDSVPGEQRDALKHVIRDQINSGHRLSQLRNILGAGAFYLLPPHAHHIIRKWRIPVFNAFVSQVASAQPALRVICEATYQAFNSADLLPSQRRLEEVATGNEVPYIRDLASSLNSSLNSRLLPPSSTTTGFLLSTTASHLESEYDPRPGAFLKFFASSSDGPSSQEDESAPPLSSSLSSSSERSTTSQAPEATPATATPSPLRTPASTLKKRKYQDENPPRRSSRAKL